jgi:hypothetical protein
MTKSTMKRKKEITEMCKRISKSPGVDWKESEYYSFFLIDYPAGRD